MLKIKEMDKKNLIFILIDGGRVDYVIGSKIFSNLKRKSSFLSQAITYAPYTVSSMHAMFTGTYGTKTGVNSYFSGSSFKNNEYKTLTEYLHDKKYYTKADVLKWKGGLIIPKNGFDEITMYDEDKDDLKERHKNIIKNIRKESDGEKFFLYLHCSEIHTEIKNKILNRYQNHSKEFFENNRENINRYKKIFGKAEEYLDSILNEIRQQGMENDSLILVASDHGVSQGEKIGEHTYGAFCYDYTLRTFAFFISNELPKKEIKQQTRTIDFLPTILDYLDIEQDKKYKKIDGMSLIPLFQGKKISEKTAFSETGNPLYEKDLPKNPNTFSIRTSKWKLIYNEHNKTEELYDLETDKLETHNIHDLEKEIARNLRIKLDKMRTVN